MSSSISSHIRSNVVGYVAVFLALGGVSYAAGLQPNSVRSKHIVDGQVKTPDLGAGAVSAAKVASDSLGGGQIDEASLAGSYRLPQSCTNGQVPKSTGTGAWACAADAGGTAYSAAANGGLALSGTTFRLAPCAGAHRRCDRRPNRSGATLCASHGLIAESLVFTFFGAMSLDLTPFLPGTLEPATITVPASAHEERHEGDHHCGARPEPSSLTAHVTPLSKRCLLGGELLPSRGSFYWHADTDCI